MVVQIKRILILLGIVFLPLQVMFSQHTSRNNYTGAWEAPASWNPVWPVPQHNINPFDITIFGYITVTGSLSFSGTSDLIINDTLVINGDLSLDNNSDLTINNNGILIVRGNLAMHNHSEIIANGYLIITGYIDKHGPNHEGSLTSNDNPVKVFVGGIISPADLTDHEPDYPAIDCTSPATVRYLHSDCSHGDMTDIITDPIYSFFQSTCSIATPDITAGGPTTFCTGGSVNLTSSTGTTYLWSNGATTQSINITASGSYTVIVTNVSGCLSAASAATVVTVNALPITPIITAGGPTTFCTGGGLTLTSSPEATYLWSNGATTQSINITIAGSYTVRVKNASGCQSATSVATIVTVNALPATPTITAGGPTTLCAGGNVNLVSGAGSTYLWSNGATTASINITSAGSYSVRVTNANGCQSAPSVATVVTVNALPATPTITAGGPVTFCTGGNVTLTSGTGTSYLWSNGATTPVINVNATGSYTVKVTNAIGCQSAASAVTVVTVNGLPITPTITASGPTTFCDGGSVTLSSSAASVYLWSDGAITSKLAVSNSGSYTVQITDANGCKSAVSAVTIVTTNTLPVTPTITAGGPETFCEGGSVTLSSSAATGYLWSDGSTISSINVNNSGSYTVQTTDANGCKSAKSLTEAITVTEMPVAIPGPDQELRFIVETQMNAELSSPFTGEWSLISGSGRISDDNSPTAKISGLSIGKNSFLWKVMNRQCKDSARVNITVLDLFIPSVITPDGDGKNDYFEIIGMTGHVELIIFNRWGNIEYSDDNYLNNWNGHNRNEMELPADTYFFILKFEKYETKKGSVLIKR